MIGKLIKSHAHTEYVCQIYGPHEVEIPPAPADYAFGSFVRLPLGGGNGALVGVIHDTQLYNPDFGNLGPRLSPESDLKIFSPDYLVEKVTLVGIMAVGMLDKNDVPTHGIPPLSVQIDTLVERMDDEAVKHFHAQNPGGVRLGYAPLLLGQDSFLSRHLLLQIIKHLNGLFPELESKLSVLHRELSWQSYIRPTGGMA